MADIKVTVSEILPDIMKLISASGGPTSQVFANVIATLNALIYAYQAQWKSFALGEPMPGAPRVIKSGAAYAQTIQVHLSDDLIKEVFTDSPHHNFIEKGHGEIDLKPGLLTGAKVRYSKSGTPYNIVAFRQDTPKGLNNPMPLNIYNLAKKEFDKADVAHSKGLAPKPGTSKMLGKGQYEWGISMPKDFGGPATTVKQTSKGDYAHKFSKYAGMVRMQASTEHAKRSGYMTFRVVSARSDPASWISPPLQGVAIRQAVVDKMRGETVELLREAIQRDLGVAK
jgi:hypothetical protein